MSNGREARVIDTFLALTDTLVGGFDALDMLTTLAGRSVELLDAVAAGVILTDGSSGGRLSVAAASSQTSRLLEVLSVDLDDGPCVDCVRGGEAVIDCDVAAATARSRWPRFTAGAAACGFRAAHALPMRHREGVIGALTLLHSDPHTLTDADARLGHALADAATIGLLHQQMVRRAETEAEQCRYSLGGRVVIEQAKGPFAGRSGVSPQEAFGLLRAHARNHNRRLPDLRRDVVTGDLDPAHLTGGMSR